MYIFGQKVEIPEMKRTSHIFPFLPVKTGNKSEINVTFFRNRNFRISHLTLERVPANMAISLSTLAVYVINFNKATPQIITRAILPSEKKKKQQKNKNKNITARAILPSEKKNNNNKKQKQKHHCTGDTT